MKERETGGNLGGKDARSKNEIGSFYELLFKAKGEALGDKRTASEIEKDWLEHKDLYSLGYTDEGKKFFSKAMLAKIKFYSFVDKRDQATDERSKEQYTRMMGFHFGQMDLVVELLAEREPVLFKTDPSEDYADIIHDVRKNKMAWRYYLEDIYARLSHTDSATKLRERVPEEYGDKSGK